MSTSRKKTRQRADRPNHAKSSPAVSSRERKHEEFTGQGRSRKQVYVAVAVVTLLIVAGVIGVGLASKKGGTAAAAPVSAGNVTIPVSQVNDGKTHFYSADVNGTTVQYFVMKASDGTLRAAFNACEVCYQFKKGYHQQGDAVQCNNCGRVFQSNQISVEQGGCNPGPIDPKISGGKLIITPSQLQEGVRFFQ